MGKRGPRPKPTAIKKLLGNPGKRTLREDEPIPPEGEIQPPAYVRADAKVFWNQLVPLLSAMKVLTTADVLTLGRYCNLLARYAELDHFLMGRGATGTTIVHKDAKGRVTGAAELPQAWEYRQVQNQLLQYEREFGLTPSARSRIKVEPSRAAAPAEPAAKPKDTEIRDFFATGGAAAPRPKPKTAT